MEGTGMVFRGSECGRQKKVVRRVWRYDPAPAGDQYRNGAHDGFVPLMTRRLEEVLGRRTWPRVLEAAFQIGLIKRDESYRAGERSKSYRLCEPYASAKWEKRAIRSKAIGQMRCTRLTTWRSGRRGRSTPRPIGGVGS